MKLSKRLAKHLRETGAKIRMQGFETVSISIGTDEDDSYTSINDFAVTPQPLAAVAPNALISAMFQPLYTGSTEVYYHDNTGKYTSKRIEGLVIGSGDSVEMSKFVLVPDRPACEYTTFTYEVDLVRNRLHVSMNYSWSGGGSFSEDLLYDRAWGPPKDPGPSLMTSEPGWYERHLAIEQYTANLTGSKLLPRLKRAKLKRVFLEYDGSGDSGNSMCMATVPDVELDTKLRADLDRYGWAAAPPGFENNEGGKGRIMIDVDAGKILRRHVDYANAQSEEEYVFSLFDCKLLEHTGNTDEPEETQQGFDFSFSDEDAVLEFADMDEED